MQFRSICNKLKAYPARRGWKGRERHLSWEEEEPEVPEEEKTTAEDEAQQLELNLREEMHDCAIVYCKNLLLLPPTRER